MVRCCHLEEACHRTLTLFGALAMVVGMSVTGVTLYRPVSEDIVAVYWSLFAGMCLQAMAMQFHRCFATNRAWTGGVSATYLSVVAAVPTHLWVRYRYECTPEDFDHLVPQEVLLHSREIHRAAQFTSIVAAVVVLSCLFRWISVRMVRELRNELREATRVEGRKRRTGGGGGGGGGSGGGGTYGTTAMHRRHRTPAVYDTMRPEEEPTLNTSTDTSLDGEHGADDSDLGTVPADTRSPR